MLKISDSLGRIINVNRFLQAGLVHRLFNLSQLTKFLKPMVEAELKKEVQPSALLMALSRTQREWNQETADLKTVFGIEKLTVQPNLFTVTYLRTPLILGKLQRYERMVTVKKGYINVSEGSREVTMIVEQAFLEDLSRYIESPPLYIRTKITGIGVQFDPEHATQPGFLYQILERIAFQGISAVEVFSTYSEFALFLNQEDARLALDTLLATFEVKDY